MDQTASSSTQSSLIQLPFEHFIWGAGIECSFIPHLDVDQFEWTQHNRFWRKDLRLARDQLGIGYLRYSLPWHLLEPQPGKFQWDLADERLAEFEKLGIEPLLDIMHFGTPLWLKQAVGDPLFPEALERFTEAMVGRYRGRVKTWCPFNEPMVSALFSGDFGFWPPHARQWRGYMPVLSRIVQGVGRGIAAIRRMMPEATVLLCDAAEHYKTRVSELQVEAQRRNLRRFVVMDLLTGRVDAHHPLYSWLIGYGMSELDLEWFRTHPQAPDVLGMDYYPHSDWQLDMVAGSVRQRWADSPAGIRAIAGEYWQRYGIPLMLSETSIDGQPINREIWLEQNLDQIKCLHEEGIPMLGLIWWPMFDQIDWDGALLHRVGKIHRVGLFTLLRRPDGRLERRPTPLVELFKKAAAEGEGRIGKLSFINHPSFEAHEEQLPPIGQWIQPVSDSLISFDSHKSGNGNGNGHSHKKGRISSRISDENAQENTRSTGRYGIVVFSHLRWGFVWQRPQQFLSRFAKKQKILFVEEPFFDLTESTEPRLDFHRVMPNVTVITPHVDPTWNRNPGLPEMLRRWTRRGIDELNEDGDFDRPLLWYYSPMDASWSLGYFPNRGIVFDAMDELSQFSSAPAALVTNEQRLMKAADIVFAGGYELSLKKKQHHQNVHFFGCGVEYDHFARAQDPETTIPPDIDFMDRPILGWFGVVDERVDYALIGEIARMRPDWSIAMVGPVVKVDPNLLPQFPNLYWMGQRDYQVLPNYCRAFDVCMMCFAINAATEYINPTKALEYLATGRPVISTPVKDIVHQYSDLVDIARTPAEWVAMIDKRLKDPDEVRIRRGIEKAQQSSWEAQVRQMQDLIRNAISPVDRPSSRTIQRLEEASLDYQYMATRGS